MSKLSKLSKFSTWLAATTSATALIAGTAYAQDDVIEVSATKRTTTLQDTPIAVSVTSQEVIERAAIQDIKDLQSVVPTLRVTQGQTSQNTNFTIRGFGNGANNVGIEPAVGLFIDGVYRSRAAAAIGDLPRLERIEVLPGPQSTLYGKNSSAGVISIVTAKPSDEEHAYLEAGYGNYNRAEIRGYMTGGNDNDDFAFSMGGSYTKGDGYADGGDQPDLNDRNRWNIRTQALWTPADNFEARVIFDRSEIDEICCAAGYVGAVDGLTPDGAPLYGIGSVAAFEDLGFRNYLPHEYKTDYNRPSNNFVDDGGISLHLDYDFGKVALTSITSKRFNDGGYNTEVDFTSAAISENLAVYNDINTFTQEVRLTSTGDNIVDWMIGGYYFDEDIDTETELFYGENVREYVTGVVSAALTGVEANAQPGDLIIIPPDTDVLRVLETNTLSSGNFLFDIQPQLAEIVEGYTPGDKVFFLPGNGTAEHFTQKNEAYSFFGQLDVDLTERLTVSGGVNYTNDRKDVSLRQIKNTAPLSAIDLYIDRTADQTNGRKEQDVEDNAYAALFALQLSPPLEPYDDKHSEDKVTYTLRGNYEVSDNLNVFGGYATGFKARSYNLSRDSRPFELNPDYPTSRPGTRYADSEKAAVWELGMKGKFDWGRFSLVFFDQKVNDFQNNFFAGTGFRLDTAGTQTSQGVEFDVSYDVWQNPSNKFDVSVAGTYVDAKFDDFKKSSGPFETTVDSSGRAVDTVHPLSVVLTGNYGHDFGNGTKGYLRASLLYESKTNIFFNQDFLDEKDFDITATDDPLGLIDNNDLTREVKTVDMSAGLSFENGVSLQAWVRNLFKDEYLTTIFAGVAQPATLYGYANEPRTYGLKIRKEFF